MTTTSVGQSPTTSDRQTGAPVGNGNGGGVMPPVHTRARPPRGHRARRRIGIVAVLIAGLVGAGALRSVAMDYQNRAAGLHGVAAPRSTLGNMNSYALALLLGGLRGPLVMFLWTTSENQKGERDLEDLDAKIEWIRLLQPEFDTVHIFQMWNKAYNISALMANPADKYAVIMQAIDYGMRVDRERPGDLNILSSLANIYNGKLAAKNLPEAPFYMRQFREESMTDAARKVAYPESVKTFHRLDDMKPLLDDNNDLRADLITGDRSAPPGASTGQEWNNGADLQYLAPYRKFPLGVSAQAMAYNYAKRAQVAQSSEGQKPLQLSPMVIDSQPGLLMKSWAENEGEQGRRREARAFGVSTELANVQATIAALKPDQRPTDMLSANDSLFCYDRTVRLCRAAAGEYRRHLSNPNYAARITIYSSHLADLTSLEHISMADHDYLAAQLASGNNSDERAKLLRDAAEHYHQGLIDVERTMLEYYTENEVLNDPAFPRAVAEAIRLHEIPDDQVEQAYALSVSLSARYNIGEYKDERADYYYSMDRCKTRLALLAGSKK